MAKKTATLHLGKPDLKDFDAVLSEAAAARLDHPGTQIVNSSTFAEGGRLYVFVGRDHTPSWVTDLGGEFPVSKPVETRSAAAVLAFRKNKRVFACSFAHGRMYLNDENFEGDFGLRVALNALDDKKLRRLERANLGDALRGISDSPFQREFASFGVDDALDLIRTISGRTREDATADAMTGSRSLKVAGEFTISDLPSIAAEALEFYESDDYKQTPFKIVDVVTPKIDLRLVAALDDAAAQVIREGKEKFELSLPVTYDDDCVEYRFVGAGLRGRHPDLLLRHYIQAMGPRLGALTSQTLKDHKIAAAFEDDSRPTQVASIRKSLVGSIEHDGGRYAINEGEWYQIDDSFKTSIEQHFVDLADEWTDVPIPMTRVFDAEGNGHYEAEGEYNRKLANALGLVLLDTKLIEIPSLQRSGFEPCDILDIEQRRLIHVKKSSRRSNVLSHFFKQGLNSAHQLSRFPEAWQKLKELVETVAGSDAAKAVPDSIRDGGEDWKVEFVIADTTRVSGEFNIPFFSKISLRDTIVDLRAMQFRVGLRFIRLPA